MLVTRFAVGLEGGQGSVRGWPCRSDERRSCRQAEVTEDPGGDVGIGDEGEEATGAFAVGAGEDVDEVDAAEEVGPWVTGPGLGAELGRRRRRCVRCRGGRRSLSWMRTRSRQIGALDLRLGGGSFGRRRYDGVTQREGGGEDPVVGDELLARRRDQGGEPLDQGEWVEDHMRRSIAPAAFELAPHFAVAGQRQSLVDDGWAKCVAAQAIEPFGVAAIDGIDTRTLAD